MFSVEFHEIWISSCICVLRVCTHLRENRWITHVIKKTPPSPPPEQIASSDLTLSQLTIKVSKRFQKYHCPWRCQSKTELIFHTVFCILFGRFTNRPHHGHKLLGIFLKDGPLYELHLTFWTGHIWRSRTFRFFFANKSMSFFWHAPKKWIWIGYIQIGLSTCATLFPKKNQFALPASPPFRAPETR